MTTVELVAGVFIILFGAAWMVGAVVGLIQTQKLIRQIRKLARELDPIVDDFGDEVKAPRDRTLVQTEQLWNDENPGRD